MSSTAYTNQRGAQEGETKRLRVTEKALSYGVVKNGVDTAASWYDAAKRNSKLFKYGSGWMEWGADSVQRSQVFETVSVLSEPWVHKADLLACNSIEVVENTLRSSKSADAMRKNVMEPLCATLGNLRCIPEKALDYAECTMRQCLPEEDEDSKAKEASEEKSKGFSLERARKLASTASHRVWRRAMVQAQRMQTFITSFFLLLLTPLLASIDPRQRAQMLSSISLRVENAKLWMDRNAKPLFVRTARAIVQPLLVRPFWRIVSFVNCVLQSMKRGPFAQYPIGQHKKEE